VPERGNRNIGMLRCDPSMKQPEVVNAFVPAVALSSDTSSEVLSLQVVSCTSSPTLLKTQGVCRTSNRASSLQKDLS